MGKEAPKPPNPYKVAKAQGEQNRQTAITEYQLGATDQITPWGNLTYDQTGRYRDGTPKFRATTTLSPAQQQHLDLENQYGTQTRQAALQQLGQVADQFGRPVDLSNEATEGRLMELGRKRLDPMWAERDQQYETDLINRGIRPGSQAYESARRTFSEGRNDAYNNLLLTGRQQSVAEALAERNQPLNELNALIHGTQIQNPGQNFVSTPRPNVEGVDLAGLVNNSYNQQMQQHNSMMGGLFGLGGAALRLFKPFG